MSMLYNCGLCCMLISVWGVVQLTMFYIYAIFHRDPFSLGYNQTYRNAWAWRSVRPPFFISNDCSILMGILYKIETITLLEDVEAEEYDDYEDFIKKTQENYSMVGLNCLIAAGIYVVMIILSWLCMHQAQRKELRLRKKSEDDEWYCENKAKVI